jgi:hypothetical protein
MKYNDDSMNLAGRNNQEKVNLTDSKDEARN